MDGGSSEGYGGSGEGYGDAGGDGSPYGYGAGHGGPFAFGDADGSGEGSGYGRGSGFSHGSIYGYSRPGERAEVDPTLHILTAAVPFYARRREPFGPQYSAAGCLTVLPEHLPTVPYDCQHLITNRCYSDII